MNEYNVATINEIGIYGQHSTLSNLLSVFHYVIEPRTTEAIIEIAGTLRNETADQSGL